MKKNKRTIATLLAIAVAVLFGLSMNTNPCLENNVEALADNPPCGLGPMCSKTGNPGTYYMKRCNNCSGSFGLYAMDVVAFCN